MNSQGNAQRRLLLYVEQDYSFDILRPLAIEAQHRGHDVRWFVFGDASQALLRDSELQLNTIKDVINFAPDAVFVPGDRVPAFIPGLKIQVFHGLNEDKRGGQYPERGLFDLYCTEGPTRTAMLAPLAEERGYFIVRETGWLKLDTLFGYKGASKTYPRPQILFASTFTPKLSAAEQLYETISSLRQADSWQWLVTLHPKMAADTVVRYKQLEGDNLTFFSTDRLVELMHRADVMVSDNSSVLQEFLLLNKPVVTFRNRAPQPCMININEPAELPAAISRALNPDDALTAAIAGYGTATTPYLDGASAGRVLDAAESMLIKGWQDKKPANLWRNLKMRRQFSYYGF